MDRIEAIFQPIAGDCPHDTYHDAIKSCYVFLESPENSSNPKVSGFIFKGFYSFFTQLINDTKSKLENELLREEKKALIVSSLSIIDAFAEFISSHLFLATGGLNYFLAILKRIGALYSIFLTKDNFDCDVNLVCWKSFIEVSDVLKDTQFQSPIDDNNNQLNELVDFHISISFLLLGKLRQNEYSESMKYGLYCTVNTLACIITSPATTTVLKEKYAKLMNYFLSNIHAMYQEYREIEEYMNSKKKTAVHQMEIENFITVEQNILSVIHNNPILYHDMVVKYLREEKLRSTTFLHAQEEKNYENYQLFFSKLFVPHTSTVTQPHLLEAFHTHQTCLWNYYKYSTMQLEDNTAKEKYLLTQMKQLDKTISTLLLGRSGKNDFPQKPTTSKGKKAVITTEAKTTAQDGIVMICSNIWLKRLQILRYKYQQLAFPFTTDNHFCISLDALVPQMRDICEQFINSDRILSPNEWLDCQTILLLFQTMTDMCNLLYSQGNYLAQVILYQSMVTAFSSPSLLSFIKDFQEWKALISLQLTIQKCWNGWESVEVFNPTIIAPQDRHAFLSQILIDWKATSNRSSSGNGGTSTTLTFYDVFDECWTRLHEYFYLIESLLSYQQQEITSGDVDSPAFQHAQTLLAEFRQTNAHIQLCDQLLSIFQSTSSSSTCSNLIRDYKHYTDCIALRSWLCLSCAKVSWLVFGDVKTSYKYAKLALSFSVPPKLQSTQPINDQTTEENIIDWDKWMPQVESLLFIAELYEYLGKSSRCLDYLAECKSIFHRSTEDQHHVPEQLVVWKAIYSLHALRIWYRIGGNIQKEIDGFRIALLQIPSSQSFERRHLVQSLHNLMKEVPEFGSHIELSSELSEVLKASCNDDEKGQSFRSIRILWGIPLCTSQIAPSKVVAVPSKKGKLTKSSSSASATLSVELIEEERVIAQKLYGSPLMLTTQRHWIHYLQGKLDHQEAKAFFQALAIPMLTGELILSHDRVRDLRRTMCVYSYNETSSTTSSSPSSPLSAWHTFLYGLSSCFVSTEQVYSLDNMSSSSSYYTETSQQIQAALLHDCANDMEGKEVSYNCPASFESIQHTLTSMVEMKYLSTIRSSSSSDKEGKVESLEQNSVSLCCFDHYQQVVILGIYSACQIENEKHSTPQVIVLPALYPEVYKVVTDWQALVFANNLSLKNTASDITTAKALTDKQKREWWNERNDYDSRMKDMLDNLEQLLSPYKSFLFVSNEADGFSYGAIDEIDDLDEAINRLVVTDQGEERGSQSPSISTVEPQRTEIDYDSAKLIDLRAYCKDRGLSAVGRKQELIDRLQAYEASDSLPSSVPQQMPSTVSFAPTPTTKTSTTNTASILFPKTPITAVAKTPFGLKTSSRMPLTSTTANSTATTMKTAMKSTMKSHAVVKLFEDDLLTNNNTTTAVKVFNHSTHDSRGGLLTGHVFLILDESWQQVPLESLPMLRTQSCSRLCSLAILLERMQQQQQQQPASTAAAPSSSPSFSSCRSISIHQNKACWYAIDIDNNLPKTQELMSQFLFPYQSYYHWDSFVGCHPPPEAIRECHSLSNLFIYCGHGAGEKLQLSRHYAHSTPVSSLSSVHAPASMLWGCSSGKLGLKGKHDPLGPVLVHLLHGAQFVIGNLWDVTDGDIDKLSMECMRLVLPKPPSMQSTTAATNNIATTTTKKKSTKKPIAEQLAPSDTSTSTSSADMMMTISESLVQARDICKLKYAVGCAPIVYGFPLSIVE